MKPNQPKLKAILDSTKRRLAHDWEAKLVALILAFLVWYIIKDQIARNKRYDFPEGYGPRTASRI